MANRDRHLGEPHDGYEEICREQAAMQLLGPLRPNVCVCAHGHRYTLDQLFPPRKAKP